MRWECRWEHCHLLATPYAGVVVFICMRMPCRQNENTPRGTIHMGYASSFLSDLCMCFLAGQAWFTA